MSEGVMIIAGGHLLTMDARLRVIVDGAVAIEGGYIKALGPLAELRQQFPAAPVQHDPDTLLMPGLINAHCHSGLLRGTAERLPVWDWLTLYVNPMHRVLQPHEAEAASWLCYAEALLSGTTTIVDMWRFMEGSAKAAEALGNRLVAVPYVAHHPDYDYFDTFEMNEALIEEWHGKADGRVRVWVGLEHIFYADAVGQRRAIDLAKIHATGIHTHFSEARIEVDEFVQRFGKRPMYALEELGFFEAPRTMLAHAVWLDDDEIAFIAERSVGIAHNPVSNLKLASGIAPVSAMRAAGIPVGIGTDGEKENNNLDMFDDMKFSSLVGKLREMDAGAVDSWDVLEMATMGGARALGLDDEIGSIEAGKRADIIAVRTDTPRMTPLFGDGPNFNLQHNLVHSVRGSDVAMTMIDGRIVVENGRLQMANLNEILDRARALAPDLFARRAAFLAEDQGSNVQWNQSH
ncbi:MAG: amidohydrolase [Pseudomonadota bacterium]